MLLKDEQRFLIYIYSLSSSSSLNSSLIISSVKSCLQIGQTLIIEEVPVNNTYIVKRGDTLYSIARELNTTVNELKRLNNLNSNIININKKLKY